MIETERLLLRHIKYEDIDNVFEYAQDEDTKQVLSKVTPFNNGDIFTPPSFILE